MLFRSGVGTGDVDPGAGVATRGFAAYTYTGSYASLIQNYISAVPEPAVSIFPVILAFAMIHRERRRGREM